MAKLNVVIPAVEVTVGDVTYRKVDRKAQVGDIIRFDDAHLPSYVRDGAFYVVEGVSDGGYPYITDEDGDRYGTAGDDFEVYAPISEQVSVNASDTITFEGATWRKVDRDAREGDAIKFTRFDDEEYSENATLGEMYIVSRVDTSGDAQIFDEAGEEYDTCGDDFEVYEKVAEEKTPQYREVKRKANVGERIKVVAIHPQSRKKGSVFVGEEFTVKTVDSVGDIWSVDERVFNGLISPDFEGVREYVVLEPVTKSAEPAKPERLAVGDYARVVNVTFAMNNGMTGEIVEITEVNEHDFAAPYGIKFVKSGDLRLALPQHVVRATDEEVAAAKRAALNAQFSVGDYVKLISGAGEYLRNGFSNGDVCTVDEPVDSDGDFRIKRTENGHRGYAQPEQIVKLTAAEIAEIERKQAEEAKWAAIGRKVNEYKRGDLTSFIGSEHLGFAEVASVEGDRIVVKWPSKPQWNACSDRATSHRLVVPVEQRFDRSADDVVEEVDAA
jgi:hypothetical protein